MENIEFKMKKTTTPSNSPLHRGELEGVVGKIGAKRQKLKDKSRKSKSVSPVRLESKI